MIRRLLWKFRIKARLDETWQDGYDTASMEADEAIEAKDNFIARQESIIVELLKGDSIDWHRVSDDLRERLCLYA